VNSFRLLITKQNNRIRDSQQVVAQVELMVLRYDEVMSSKASKISLEEFKDTHARDFCGLMNKVDNLNTK
jgi:hypothetical protein